MEWKTAPTNDIEASIAVFKAKLPGWWFSVCECQVSCDASCAPTSESEHIKLAYTDKRFDDGFHADLLQPSSLAEALRDVQQQALTALAEYAEIDQ